MRNCSEARAHSGQFVSWAMPASSGVVRVRCARHCRLTSRSTGRKPAVRVRAGYLGR